MSEWQPIETAPRDGTVIEAYAIEGRVRDTWYDDTLTPKDEMARLGAAIFGEPVWWCRIEDRVSSFMPRFWRPKNVE